MKSMKLKSFRRSAVGDADPGASQQQPTAAVASGRSVVESSLISKGVTVFLWLGLIAGLPALGVAVAALSASSAPVQSSAAKTVNTSDDQAAAGEFAQHLVVTWLRSSRSNDQPLKVLAPNLSAANVPEVAFKASEPGVAAVKQSGGVWAVTVAVTVTDAQKPPVRRFFEVPVVIKSESVAALALPHPVAGPVAGEPDGLDYRNAVDTTGPVAQTVQQFLDAFIAGRGDVTRYVTPGVALLAIAPPPYTAVKVQELRAATDVDTIAAPPDGAKLKVLVAAEAVVSAKQFSNVTYALALTARAGRWEVSSIESTPAVSPEAPGAVAPGTSAPTPVEPSSSPTTP